MSIKTWMLGSTVFSSDFLFNFRSLTLFFFFFFLGILNQDTKHFIFQRSVSAFCFPPLNGQTVPVHNQTFSKGTFPPWITWPLIFHSFLLRVWWTVDSPPLARTPVLGSGQSVRVSVREDGLRGSATVVKDGRQESDLPRSYAPLYLLLICSVSTQGFLFFLILPTRFILCLPVLFDF